MFGNKKEKTSGTSEKRFISGRNIIEKGTKIVGDIISQGDFRIDGEIEGNVKTKGRVIIGKEGVMKGAIECTNADVEGKFSGNFIVTNMLTAKSTAIITGDVAVGQISTEPGATFNATCNMKGAIKDISKLNAATEEKTEQTA